MRARLARLGHWLDDRTGLPAALRQFLDEEIPASSGWHQVLGSVALFLFLTQAFTGALLALNYAPAPGEAYHSIRYIMSEVTGGALLRGLHHWGASFMVVIVVLHMLQVFLWGAYRKPREVTWMIGVVLLLLTLAYALTGYLLPWDNRAYWGTVVTTQIAASAPGLGPYILRLMGAEQGVGVVTFARFYSVHVLLLPPLTVLLIVLHVYLVRRHGVAPAPGDELKPGKKFYPGQVFKDTAAIFAVFALLFTLAVAVKAPLGRLADPTDTAYLPRPEWYFLFLFQLLKYFEGPLEVLASVVLPGLAVALLMAAPFLDRGAVRRVTQRTTALLIAGLAGIGWAGLTLAAIASTPPGAVFGDSTGPQQWRELSPVEVAGIGFFHREKCESCHALGVRAEPKSSPGAGPNLGAATTRRDAAWLIAHFTEPSQVVPGSSMPPLTLSRSQLSSLASFLLRLTPENAEKLTETPVFAREGAILYQRHRCEMCHQVNGAGQPLGLSLNGLARRRDAAWVRGHFLDPRKYSPGTTMPPYEFSETENDQITAYLLALP
ncbi:MAG: cytochrome b N-terminal domain-containing protein [Bryobacteraceae bacterium]|nr:cytochrome b N-terminal domain-containing protein [Solibacteraceae bacterium]MCO5350134.1 cytochrome b N-terminal domain-containing protein [Bryobacteraceae bacterium]